MQRSGLASYSTLMRGQDFFHAYIPVLPAVKTSSIPEAAEKAKVHFKKAIEINSSSAYDIAYLGLCTNKEGNIAARDQYFRRAEQIDPDIEREMLRLNYWQRPNHHKYPGNIQIIEEGYLNAVLIDTTFLTSYNDLAYLYSIEGINLDLALDYVERTLKEDPDNYHVLDTKAWVLYKLGRFEEADSVMAKVTKLTPQEELYNFEYLYHKGMIAMAVGDKETGKADLLSAQNIPEPDAIGMRIKEEIEVILEEL